jgi:polyisoprenoid-binding protein YceI
MSGTWIIDPLHSAATFSVKYLSGRFRGEFEGFDAELADGKLTGSVDVTSINIRHDHFRTQVIEGDQLFDVANHPKLSFSSSDIKVDGNDVVVEGELTLKGISKPIRATGTIDGPLEDFTGKTRLGLTLATTIDRTDYGMGWQAPGPLPTGALANEVELDIDLALVAPKAE